MNDMECDRIESTMRAWEAGRPVGAEEAARLSAHITECRACAARWGRLLPLVLRDERPDSPGLPLLPARDDDGSADAVIEGMRREWTRPRRKAPPPAAIILAAAALLAAGLVPLALGRIRRPAADRVVVEFRLKAVQAGTVHLTGDFAGWDPRAVPMAFDPAAGEWRALVELERGRSYSYNFIIDGTTWISDPSSGIPVDDGYSGESSVIDL